MGMKAEKCEDESRRDVSNVAFHLSSCDLEGHDMKNRGMWWACMTQDTDFFSGTIVALCSYIFRE